MNENWITVLVSLFVGIGSSYVTFRLQFERFRAMDEQREKDWTSWRLAVDARADNFLRRIDTLEKTYISRDDLDRVLERMRVERLQMSIDTKERVDRMERSMEVNAAKGQEDRDKMLDQMQKILTRLAAFTGDTTGSRRSLK